MKKSAKNIILSIIGVILLAVATFVFLLGWQGSTDKIVSVADQFQADPSWTLRFNQTTPSRIVCINDTPCPSLQKSWETNGVTKNKLNARLEKTGWDTRVDEECVLNPEASGTGIEICSAKKVIVDGFSVYLSVSVNTEHPNKPIVDLYIEKK